VPSAPSLSEAQSRKLKKPAGFRRAFSIAASLQQASLSSSPWPASEPAIQGR
jgi:hypothetical protein